MTYRELLEQSAKQVGNCACMGLDPVLETLPGDKGMPVRERVNGYFMELFRRMGLAGLAPAAFKPNIGYYAVMDNPRDEDFSGSQALADVLDMVENFFPSIPVILDSKRGDIAKSSANYAEEAFRIWGVQALTVSPYMGSDSVSPFTDAGSDKGVYVLCRTSNPGGKDLENLKTEDGTLYRSVAKHIVKWKTGAVVGATNMTEFADIITFFKDDPVPLLVPGVGSQGGSAVDVMDVLSQKGYPKELVRINSSSGLTHPWKNGEAPEEWLDLCIAAIRNLTEETAI